MGKNVLPFPEKLRESLTRVVDRGVADYGTINSSNEWPLSAPEIELAGAEVVRQVLATLGFDVSLAVAYGVWELYSEDLGAGWVDSQLTLKTPYKESLISAPISQTDKTTPVFPACDRGIGLMITAAKLKNIENYANGMLSSPVVTPTNPTDERKSRMWNMWARTSRGGDGVITHVFEEGTDKARAGRSICGVRSYDGGGLNMLYDDYEPGCIKCRKLLRQWSLLPHEDTEN
jgi:hypothetical protein